MDPTNEQEAACRDTMWTISIMDGLTRFCGEQLHAVLVSVHAL